LSGWISLRSAALTAGARLGNVEWTGSHAASIQAVNDVTADLAAIDAVSWAHLDHGGLFEIGHGPRIPSLPLVTAARSGRVDELRSALADALTDPRLTGVCQTLKIRGFLERQIGDYEGLSGLVELG
jgi:ABC-type phosphate/phosphonate transport system substrate-binding protein